MASDNPFAHLGLGMMGQDAALARQMATPEGSEKGRKLLGMLAGEALDAAGIKDFLDKLGASEDKVSKTASPQTYSAGIAPSQPIVPDYSLTQGKPPSFIDSKALHFAPPNALRFPPSATYAGGISPYQTTQEQDVDDEHRKQIKSAWE